MKLILFYLGLKISTKLKITDTKLYVPAVSSSTQDNTKLLQQLKSGFKRTINWNKYQSKIATQGPNPYLDYLIDPSFQGVNRLFVLSYENITDRTVHTEYFLPKVEIKDHNVMINGQNFFDQAVKNNLRTYDNIQNIATGQGDDYATGCFKHYKMIAIDLCKQQALNADLKAIQQINLAGNLNRGKNDQGQDINDNMQQCFSLLKK